MAAGLAALLAAVVLAIVLSYGPRLGVRHPVSGRPPSAPLRERRTMRAAAPPASVHAEHFRASGYAFAYPSGWQVSQRDQPVASYRQTALESADGTAKVTLDYSPGESTDPAAKAAQVEVATSRTPGYRRISFGPTTVDGHAAYGWEFMVADVDPRRADLFIRTASGGFALLAHGADLGGARTAARSIAEAISRGG